MATLFDTLRPLVLAINQEGGNFSSFHLSKPVLDAIDDGAPTDPTLNTIRKKILEKVDAYGGKRDHLGFNQIFEAYSEGVIYLVATRRRRVPLTAIDDGTKHGKTPDFATVGAIPIGLEVKTINVVDPARTIDAAMDRAFEAGYAATERARAAALKTGKGGVGFAEQSFAPHGEGADAKEAVEQTIKKIRSNIKAGQYAARPTLLVVSLVRLGLQQQAVELRRLRDTDTDCDVAPSGHLFAVAANRLEDPFFGYSHKWFGARDAGPLSEAGILLDHDYIAGLVFLETEWSKSGDADAIQTGFRFNGIWNTKWDPGSRFSREAKAEAKRVFEALCDAWNDANDSRTSLIPDVHALHAIFMHCVGDFVIAWRGKTPGPQALATFMAEADRAYFIWKCGEAGMPEANAAAAYTAPGAEDVHTGHLTRGGASAMFISCRPDLPTVPRLHLVKAGARWELMSGVGQITGAEIVV